jgi:hypothetical protein
MMRLFVSVFYAKATAWLYDYEPRRLPRLTAAADPHR